MLYNYYSTHWYTPLMAYRWLIINTVFFSFSLTYYQVKQGISQNFTVLTCEV